MKTKALVIEFWGLGDATLATAAARELLDAGCEVTMLCKPASRELLAASYPELHFRCFTAPWTKFRGKYRLWEWPWRELWMLIRWLRAQHFDIAISWRPDPRDHALAWLSGARLRGGRPVHGSGIFLNRRAPTAARLQHTVDSWRDVLRAVDIPLHNFAPALSPTAGYCHLEAPAPTGDRPTFLIHCGAQIAVRRWPSSHLRHLIAFLRRDFDFRLVLVPDPDGYGSELSDLADFVAGPLTLGGLVDLIASCDLVICNDSAPAHIASALGKRVIAFFGPQLPERFAPYGSENLVVIRDLCEFRPCSDYCRFAEPKCLTQLTPEMAWADIKPYLEKHFASCRHDSSSKHPVD